MEPTTNEIKFKVSYDEYQTYYNNYCENNMKTYYAFGRIWFVICLEAIGSELGFSNPQFIDYFVTFRVSPIK
jgi:hypothetical protein